jgi:signal transduction histidine kinase
MPGRLYRFFIAPKQRSEDIRNREVVLNVLLSGTLLMLLAALPLSVISLVVLRHHYALSGVLSVLVATALVSVLFALSRSGHYRVAAFILVGIYFLLATMVVYRWGITIPVGVLLNGLVIVLAGILLGSVYSLWAAGVIGVLFVALQELAQQGVIKPDWSWVATRPTIIDALSFCLIFALIALVSWLFNNQMERSLKRARRAEAGLKRQKQLLETTVEKRTRQLQDAQLERVQQMYRFAELGQLSTALLHDLANHLTSLSLDIEGLEEQSRSSMLRRAKRSIRYIDDMVARVRDQLHGRSQIRPFNVASEIEEVVTIMTHRAQDAGVQLVWQPFADKKALRARGEPIRFRQLIANLLSNAIDAYEPDSKSKREVLITADATADKVIVTFNDWGRGIPQSARPKLFEPFYSTKKTGMGMGLFIARQIAEEHLGGSLHLDSGKKHTAFVLTLARA